MEPLNLNESPFFQGIQGFKPVKKSTQPTSSVPNASKKLAESVPIFNLLASVPSDAFAVPVDPLSEVPAPISTDPKVNFDEDNVSREWYIDDVVQR